MSPEKRGDTSLNTYVRRDDDYLSIEIRRWENLAISNTHESNGHSSSLHELGSFQPFYLLCPSEVSVGHLEKLILMKFSLQPNEYTISIFFSPDDLFNSDYALSDLACLYVWRRQEPLKLFFEIRQVSGSSSLYHADDRLKLCINPDKNERMQSLLPVICKTKGSMVLDTFEHSDETKQSQFGIQNSTCMDLTNSDQKSSSWIVNKPFDQMPPNEHSIQNIQMSLPV